ncbi:hypothetical protein L3X38_041174 [Prunus dulcis]|uniref:Disease resistance protein Roq1-like winged-helix domain-containing protein n=1 Tax=Prunus dulcis TaxID=3755 RepID=A0AAD4UU94_PRUDU|nr:hypothetical protein L3X38_041174 [Prunus dulcis]
MADGEKNWFGLGSRIIITSRNERLLVQHGLPLALKTLGSFLNMRDQDAWNSVLDNLKKIPNPTVFDSLKISYDGLEEMEKIIFLDVACFHKGKHKETVIEILDSVCDISSRIGIDILIEKSLLTIERPYFDYNIINMHDLIQEMAWGIVRKKPNQRNRLWLHDDVSRVFMNNTETRAIEARVLRLPKLEVVH